MTNSDPYEIRQYESADRDAFLDLFADVLGGQMGNDWFTWKYERNPYVNHVPILVAQRDDELVGARAFFPLRLAAGDDEFSAFQPCDSMVRPEHQRRGLFTRLTERAIDRYDDADLFFNFPNHRSLPGNLKLGWRVASERETYYRIQNPTAWLPQLEPVEPIARSLASGYVSIRDRFADSTNAVELSRYDRVPSSLLATLASSETIPEFHVARDETFYEWRFANPLWTYRTIVATRDGAPIAAVVYGRRDRTSGPTVVRILDVLPLAAGTSSSPSRQATLAALLDAVLRETGDADVIAAPGSVVPRSVLRSRGFHSDQRAPLKWGTSPSTHVVRPAGTPPLDWTLSGAQLADSANWRLAFCEVDSG
ncbi:GNAT family N-acetyltransferase [Haloterrigena salifodinae]|uniref:GNAT family N-acetyltransferase n=1 Tax=Haloterrigena salifodinae TaxID=2675099 RepID=A0A8T8E543_9EURY|nr:GNAT family N-acetyltransferase [Haloterrigena salifodinae]QRV16552.1 GNAT family N-acetyltransferase [Haloterrigena salifodinae]